MNRRAGVGIFWPLWSLTSSAVAAYMVLMTVRERRAIASGLNNDCQSGSGPKPSTESQARIVRFVSAHTNDLRSSGCQAKVRFSGASPGKPTGAKGPRPGPYLPSVELMWIGQVALLCVFSTFVAQSANLARSSSGNRRN